MTHVLCDHLFELWNIVPTTDCVPTCGVVEAVRLKVSTKVRGPTSPRGCCYHSQTSVTACSQPARLMLLRPMLSHLRVKPFHVNHQASKHVVKTHAPLTGGQWSPNLKQGVDNTNTKTCKHSYLTSELRFLLFFFQITINIPHRSFKILIVSWVSDYVFVQLKHPSSCLFCGVFNLCKMFSEEKLFTVLTSGLLAAFYSLCTEIKFLFGKILVCLFVFFCSFSCSLRTVMKKLKSECWKLWLSIWIFPFAFILEFACGRINISCWDFMLALTSVSFTGCMLLFLLESFTYLTCFIADLIFRYVHLPLHKTHCLMLFAAISYFISGAFVFPVCSAWAQCTTLMAFDLSVLIAHRFLAHYIIFACAACRITIFIFG